MQVVISIEAHCVLWKCCCSTECFIMLWASV